MSKASIEQQGLLEPESFDLDDLESADPSSQNGHPHANGHTRNSSTGGRKTLTSAPRWLRRKWILIAVIGVVALLVIGAALNKRRGFKIPKIHNAPSSPPPPPSSPPPPFEDAQPPPGKPPGWKEPVEQWEKPQDFKIMGLIFFGRPSVVAILDCYLKRNLVTAGGWLDEVHFVVNTDREDDIRYLDELVKTNPLYKKVVIPSLGYNAVWKNAVEEQHMYIKIDDDIVYFNDEAIPDIVYTKMHHPQSLNVVANLVNSPETGWLHYRLGAIHAYLPELQPPNDPAPDSKGPRAWRASALPPWKGKKMGFPVAGANNGKPDDGGVLDPSTPGAPPFWGHRWLPIPDGEENLWRTPMSESKYDPDGPDWASWSLGAQAHYSLLENLENGDLTLYHYGHGLDPEREGIWNMAYERMNINFMAIWGKDVRDNLPFHTLDDELELSVTVNKELRRPLLVNTHAIAAHFSFRSQHEMYDTDLLDRYRAYANEMICAKDNQIMTP